MCNPPRIRKANLRRSFQFALFASSLAPLFAQGPGSAEFFENKVRPVLAQNCAPCHNTKLTSAGLDLSTTAGIAKGGDSGPVFVNGHPDQSRIIEVTGYQQKLKMPPAGKLPENVLADLRNWIASGAALPSYKVEPVSAPVKTWSDAKLKHWSFQPVKDYPAPMVKDAESLQNPIDRFIFAKLQEKGLRFPKPADKLTLIRRAKYDLLGLPPTDAEIRAFLDDASPDAFAKLVDGFLASPHYGEKWGRHWLDVARYAESCGVDDNDPYTEAWRYREYVIDAMNRDEPYNQFVREQVAGDLLPSMDGSQVNVRGRVATGFLALGPKATVEMDKVKTTYDIVDEQIDTTSKAFLGLTVACARCHDHKFDPIATKDYYSMAAIFANTLDFEHRTGDFFTERKSKLYLAPLVDQAVYNVYQQHQQKIAAKNMQAAALVENQVWDYSKRMLFPRLADYMVASWKIQHHDAKLDELAAAKNLDSRILREWVIYLDPKGGVRPHLERWQAADDTNVEAIAKEYAAFFDRNALHWGENLIEWKAETERAVRGERDLPKQPNIEYNSTTAFTDPTGRFFSDVVISVKTLNDKSSKDGPFVIPDDQKEKYLSPEGKEQLAGLKKESEALVKSSPQKPPMANAVAEGPAVNQKVFLRGNYSSPGEPVQPDVPAILRTASTRKVTQGSGRKELADFLTDPQNPLTARVMVNRVWQWHFGEGLVKTSNNFGLMGERPSHPELLDYLAKRFVESGWSLKSMHRMMMLSKIYQSSSETSNDAYQADPANRLLSRFERRPMTIEEMRDTWLSLSNSLDLRMGGIFDPVDSMNEPRGMGKRGGASPRSFEISKRRTVYVGINRTAVATPMVLYDFVDSSTSAGDRPETIIAPQALYLMNNPFVMKNAASFAARVLEDPTLNEEARIRKAYWMAWEREPASGEVEGALAYIRKYPASEKSEFGGWQSFCRILISANQFFYVD